MDITKRRMVSPVYGAATREDVAQAAKAVHDEVSRSVSMQVKSLREEVLSQLRDSESSLSLRFGKTLEVENKGLLEGVVTKAIDNLANAFEQKRADDAERFYKALTELGRKYQEHAETLRKGYEAGLEYIKALVQGMPVPTVVLPDAAIQVQQLPSQVTLPTDAIRIEVQQVPSQVQVSVPVPSVNVAVPEQPVPQVSVNVPAPKAMRKFIQYDDLSRPAIITEEETQQ